MLLLNAEASEKFLSIPYQGVKQEKEFRKPLIPHGGATIT